MTGFVDVLGVDELASGQMTDINANGETLLLARDGDRFFATQARCPHLHGRLSAGTLEGSVVKCPRHGSQFDLVDGRVIRWTEWTGVVEAVAETLRHPRPLQTYEVRVDGGRVLIGPPRAQQ